MTLSVIGLNWVGVSDFTFTSGSIVKELGSNHGGAHGTLVEVRSDV